VLIGIVLRVLIHFPPLMAAGFRYRPTLDWRQPRLRELFGKMPMALAGMAVAHLMISINMFFATFMGKGYATHLRFSARLKEMPLAILASAMATAILPQLTQYLHEGRRDDLRNLFGFVLRLLVILFLPATVGMVVLGRPIVALLFERGAWSAEATDGTAWALLFYSLGLLPTAGLQLVIPLYYARLDLRTPVTTGIVAVAVNIAFNLFFFLFTPMKQGGLALATTLAITTNLALLLYRMRQEIGGALDRRLAETLWKCLAAAGGMGLLLWGLVGLFRAWAPHETFMSRAALIAVAAPLGAGAYFGLAAAMRTPDLNRALDLLRRRLSASQSPPRQAP
jgi:putative peptidoglycan lipid II flippase